MRGEDNADGVAASDDAATEEDGDEEQHAKPNPKLVPKTCLLYTSLTGLRSGLLTPMKSVSVGDMTP